ncbi:NAD(P)/FAD-dependent oxidoreductase [Megamonas sp.]
MQKVIVIGGGAAGLMAAATAAQNGAEVLLLEKNDRLGKKLLITGKGRCNVTNTAVLQDFVKNIPGNGRFLYSVFSRFFNWDTWSFFEELNVPLKEERGGRVFPMSDKAADIVNAFTDLLRSLAVQIKYNENVSEIKVENGKAIGVVTTKGDFFAADSVILATGGTSYPGTGSNGDGFKIAQKLGHHIVELHPALVPLECEEDWVKNWQGLSLRNVNVKVIVDGREEREMFGEMLFTHFGVSGPIILSLSRQIALDLRAGKTVELSINLKPALTREQLDKRICRDFAKYSRKQIKNALGDLLPSKMIEDVIDLAFIDGDKFVNQISREERERLVDLLQNLTITITRTRPLSEAIVTGGGISTKEINPKTMESRLIRGLYCIGEVVDVDAFTGGYNLQAAFSMGYAAGVDCVKK